MLAQIIGKTPYLGSPLTCARQSSEVIEVLLVHADNEVEAVEVGGLHLPRMVVEVVAAPRPMLTHTTVGPAESRFYYNEEKESYNVPLTPVTFTYSPEIKSVTKSGSEYTLTVDYIDELPEWLPKTSSKSVEFKLHQTSEGYQIKSMKVLSENNNI